MIHSSFQKKDMHLQKKQILMNKLILLAKRST